MYGEKQIDRPSITTVFQLAHNMIPRDSCDTHFIDKINALYQPVKIINEKPETQR
jgi:hypothetical protein